MGVKNQETNHRKSRTGFYDLDFISTLDISTDIESSFLLELKHDKTIDSRQWKVHSAIQNRK
jgi:hypothetical protein